jgi:hypothetical protein
VRSKLFDRTPLTGTRWARHRVRRKYTIASGGHHRHIAPIVVRQPAAAMLKYDPSAATPKVANATPGWELIQPSSPQLFDIRALRCIGHKIMCAYASRWEDDKCAIKRVVEHTWWWLRTHEHTRSSSMFVATGGQCAHRQRGNCVCIAIDGGDVERLIESYDWWATLQTLKVVGRTSTEGNAHDKQRKTERAQSQGGQQLLATAPSM